MRRVISRRQATGVSLFPFLAVLICTMGSLIVVLVLVVKRAEAHAKTQTEEHAQQQANDKIKLNEELEEQQWRQEVLAEKRPEMVKKLASHRAELSHLEEHILKLQEQATQLEKQLNDLEQIDTVRKQDQGGLKSELAKLREKIEREMDALNEARKTAANKPKSYSLVPYKGPNGTARRPIYIECTATGVVIQPEGVVLRPGDFMEPLVPGNPLDAALLSIREFLVRSGAVTKDGEPYPLLIVRPGGTQAYAMARAAMKSWDDEFGYELIDDSLKLKYQKPDAALERTIRKAVELARLRQEALAKAQPSRFNGDSSPTGGNRNDDGPLVLRPRPGGGGFIREGSGGEGDSFFDRESENNGFGSSEQGRNPNESRDGSSQNMNPESGTPNPKFGEQAKDGQPGSAPNAASFGGSQNSLSESRGKNWALKNYSSTATAYTRPIRVVCYADRIVLLPAAGTGERPYVTPIQGNMVKATDEFVSNAWKHMQGWGIAGRSAYWKPILSIEVAPNGTETFDRLNRLLEGSGLDVRRKR